MSIVELDIDKQIQQHEQKIAELQALRESQAQKLVGIEEFDQYIKKLCQEKDLTEAELYVSRSEQIEAWILSLAKKEYPSSIYLNLVKHFSRVANKEAKKGSKKSSLPKPKLAVGVYEHPVTKQRIEKIRRNPRELDAWVNEHGLSTVRSWKVN